MTEDIGSKALSWLTKEGFSVEQTARDGFSSRFNVYSPGRPDFKILVSQVAGEDKVVLTAGVMLAESQRTKLSLVPFEKRTELAVGLGALLHARSTPFTVDDEQGVISRITVSRRIYSDGFTKEKLMESVDGLFSTTALVLINLADFFSKLQIVSEGVHPSVSQSTAMPTNPQPRSVCPACGSTVNPKQKFCVKCGANLVPAEGSPAVTPK